MLLQSLRLALRLALKCCAIGGLAAGLVLTATPAHGAFPGANGKIVFESRRDGQAEIYAMNADGAAQTRLTFNASADGEPVWSADGLKIAFQSGRDDPNPTTCFPACLNEIYVMNADGSGQTNLTNHPASDYRATWSPDGSKLAFTSERETYQKIFAMNANGSGQTRLTNNPPDDHPAWSPDGSKIAFASYRDGNYEIYVMNADGTGQTRLTNNSANDWLPDWSPYGSKIAFASDRDGGDFEIYVMNANGSGQTRITTSPALDYYPAWSPSGTKIAFTTARDGGNFEIYAMNADGSDQTNLSNDPANDFAPDWQALPIAVGGISTDLDPDSSGSLAALLAAVAAAAAIVAFACVSRYARRR